MIAVIDYGMGNLASIRKGLEHVGAEVVVTSDPKQVIEADKIVLPGVGAFKDGIKHLREFGLDNALHQAVLVEKKPFLGICLGMQLIAKKSYEFGEHEGLGFIDVEVKRFTVDKTYGLPVPHVGWNTITFTREHPLFQGVANGVDVYFVHSYYLDCVSNPLALALCNYGDTFVAAVAKDNIAAVQFHPEKSQRDGLKILKNFIHWQPEFDRF